MTYWQYVRNQKMVVAARDLFQRVYWREREPDVDLELLDAERIIISIENHE